MTWWDKIFLAGYFLGVILVQCIWQAKLFNRNLRVNKRLHELYYLLTTLPVIYFFWPMWWHVLAIGVLERLALFDFILNTIRRKPLWYNGRGTTDSLQDKIENNLSIWAVKALKVSYVIIFIVILIYIK